MPERKNQHYVPQFYLRNFSTDGGNCTALINLGRRKVVPIASIAGQCAGEFFYGSDLKAEGALSKYLEGPASKAIREVISTSTLPRRFTDAYAALLVFAVFQHGRTQAAADEGAEFFQAAIAPGIKRMAVDSGDFKPEDLEEVDIVLDRPANLTLATSIQMLPLILDLEIELLINQTPEDFITSDHPVVKRNQYFAGNFKGGVTGWAAIGLQVFLPLSPRHEIMLYDSRTYKVGSKNADHLFLTQPQDVDALNRLQLLNARQNIYFRDASQGSRILGLFGGCENQRIQNKVATREFHGIDNTGAPIQGQHTFGISAAFAETLSFCKVLRAKRRIPPKSRDYGPRQPELAAAQKRFLGEVDSGKWRPDQWSEFLDSFVGKVGENTPNT